MFISFICTRVEKSTRPLLICTWFLKNQLGKIKLDKLDFLSISNLIFTACVDCKNQFRNWFLQAKNPVRRNWFFKVYFQNSSTYQQGVRIKAWTDGAPRICLLQLMWKTMCILNPFSCFTRVTMCKKVFLPCMI